MLTDYAAPVSGPVMLARLRVFFLNKVLTELFALVRPQGAKSRLLFIKLFVPSLLCLLNDGLLPSGPKDISPVLSLSPSGEPRPGVCNLVNPFHLDSLTG